MSYKKNMPDLQNPITEKQYSRLYKYCFNSGKYILENYNYSKKQLIDFYRIKRGIPENVFVIYDVKDKNGNTIGEKREKINVINDILKNLEEDNILNEEKSIVSKIRMYTQNRKGKNFIISKLTYDGFDKKQVESILDKEIEEDFDLYINNMKRQAYSVVRKPKFLKSSSWERKKMIITSLANRGYEINEIYKLIDSEDFKEYFE